MTPVQVREWLDILDADEFARRHDLPDLARFILATGLRLGEALGVRWSDIDPDRGSLRVERTVIRIKGQGPGCLAAEVPLIAQGPGASGLVLDDARSQTQASWRTGWAGVR